MKDHPGLTKFYLTFVMSDAASIRNPIIEAIKHDVDVKSAKGLSFTSSGNRSAASFTSVDSNNPSTLSSRRRTRDRLFRRTSSFGGGPIIVKQEPPETVLVSQTSSQKRWLVLFLCCSLLFGNFYGTLLEYLFHLLISLSLRQSCCFKSTHARMARS